MFLTIRITNIQVETEDALSLPDFLINVYTGKSSCLHSSHSLVYHCCTAGKAICKKQLFSLNTRCGCYPGSSYLQTCEAGCLEGTGKVQRGRRSAILLVNKFFVVKHFLALEGAIFLWFKV